MSDETTGAGVGEHVWRTVGPNAAELWSQCVNCRANKDSIEGGSPCRNPERAAEPDAGDVEALAEAADAYPRSGGGVRDWLLARARIARESR